MGHEHLTGEAVTTTSQATTHHPSERDICDAYLYLLGRLLVLRQEHYDLISGMRWNQLVHRRGDMDVAYSEAWIGVDESSCTMIDLPEIVGRYYTIHVSNLWGETVVNVNERTFPDHPSGCFAFCLKGTRIALPSGTERIDLPGRKARLFVRIERSGDPEGAFALQQQIAMRVSGRPVIPAAVGISLFPNEGLPGVEAFDTALSVLASEQDINPEMEVFQAKVRTVGALIRNEAERRRIDQVIRQRSWGLKHALFATKNDWVTQRMAGNYGSDWLARTAANLFALWSNNKNEVMTFKAGTTTPLDGNQPYALRFERDDLPAPHVRYFWSVSCTDRHSLSSRSPLELGRDGSLTLYFAPRLPTGAPQSNWLATPVAQSYILTWRSYGPDRATVSGFWSPPPVKRIALYG